MKRDGRDAGAIKGWAKRKARRAAELEIIAAAREQTKLIKKYGSLEALRNALERLDRLK